MRNIFQNTDLKTKGISKISARSLKMGPTKISAALIKIYFVSSLRNVFYFSLEAFVCLFVCIVLLFNVWISLQELYL